MRPYLNKGEHVNKGEALNLTWACIGLLGPCFGKVFAEILGVEFEPVGVDIIPHNDDLVWRQCLMSKLEQLEHILV